VNKPYWMGALLGELFLVISYMIDDLLGYFSWMSIILSLIFPVYMFAHYLRKHTDRTNEISHVWKVSITGALTYLGTYWLIIKLVNPFVVRDVGDVVIPYIYTFRAAVGFVIIFIVAGFFITNRRKD
jgi:amino acid transporter